MTQRRAAKLDLSEEVFDLDDSMEEYTHVREKVLNRLSKMGFEPAPMPRKKGRSLLPEMPDSPSEISNKEVTNKRGEILSVYSYAVETRALADITAEALEEEVRSVYSALYNQSRGTVEERKAKIFLHEKYIKLNVKRLEWKGISNFLRARCDSLSQADKLLSRDVEFRRLESEKYKRDHNVNRIKRKMERTFGGDDS